MMMKMMMMMMMTECWIDCNFFVSGFFTISWNPAQINTVRRHAHYDVTTLSFSLKNDVRQEPITGYGLLREMTMKLLVFRVTPFKIDQNKNQNRSIDKVQNLGNERTYIYKDPRQDSGQRNISYTRYPKKCFTQTYRDLCGDAMLVLTWMSSNMADGNQQKHLLPSFATKAWIYSSRNS